MVLKTRDVRKQLLNKFHFIECNTDHKKYELFIDGEKIVQTKISHGGKDIHDNILGKMAKQVGVVRLSYFKEMILCTKSEKEYIQELRRNKFID